MDVREKLVDIFFCEFCMVTGDSPCGCDGSNSRRKENDNLVIISRLMRSGR